MLACQPTDELPELLEGQFSIIVLVQGAHQLFDRSRIRGILKVIVQGTNAFMFRYTPKQDSHCIFIIVGADVAWACDRKIAMCHVSMSKAKKLLTASWYCVITAY